MQQNFEIVLFIIIWSLISTGISFSLRKKKDEKKSYGFQTFFYYFVAYYGIMSVVKMVLGDLKETLFESLWDAQISTYIHYGIPLMIISVIMPFLMKLVFKEKDNIVISMMNSMFFAEITVAFILGIELWNSIYSILFVIAGVVAIVYGWIDKNKCYEKKDVSLAICSWGVWIVLTVFSIPNELYLTNINEFPITYGRFLISIIIGGVIIGVVAIWGSIKFLTPCLYKVICLFIFSVSVMGYGQSMVLNGKLTAMDGEVQIWSIGQQIFNSIIWVITISVIYLCYKIKESNIKKIYKGIAIYIMAIQVVSFVVLIFSTDIGLQKVEEALTTQSATEISSEKNVLVFIVDRFDGETMDEIISENSSFVEPLKDFTYYENATCQFARTSMAIPYLLTGVEWPNGMGELEYPTYAYKNSSVLHDMVQNGYDIGIYTDISFVNDMVTKDISNYSESVERKCNIFGTVRIMMQCAKYRMAPFAVKSYYSYYTRDIIENMVDSKGVWNVDNDIPFYNLIQENGISVMNKDKQKGAFRLYHLYGAHPPYRMTDDLRIVDDWESSLIEQAKGSLKIIFCYIEQLKAVNKYDDSTILIIADHGIQIGSNEGDNPIPLILVKEAGKSQETLQISEAPVSQKEFLPTILDAMDIDRSMYGRTYSEVPLEEVNERMHANIWDNSIDTYIISGNAKNPDNWYCTTE